MGQATLTRDRDLEPGSPGSRSSRVVGAVALVLLLGVVGVAGWWGLSGRQTLRSVAVGEAIEIPGGLMMVEEVRPEIMVHDMAPGMTMPDQIPDGYRRFSVDLLFQGGKGGTMIEPADLYVAGDGFGPVAPHRVVGTVSPLPEGSTLARGVLFQTPIEVDNLWLGYEGADTVVTLEGDLGEAHDHGDEAGAVHDHADHDHDDEGMVPDVEIEIDDSKFLRSAVTVEPGTTVGWVNLDDGVPHTVTFSEGGPDSGVMQSGETFSVELDFAGTYSYFCEIHPSMRGRIVVESG